MSAEHTNAFERNAGLLTGLEVANRFHETLTRERTISPTFALYQAGGYRALEDIETGLHHYRVEFPFIGELLDQLKQETQALKSEARDHWPTIKQAVDAEGRYVESVAYDIWPEQEVVQYFHGPFARLVLRDSTSTHVAIGTD